MAMKITGHRTRAIFERYNITTTEDLKHAAELQAKNANGYNNGDNSEKSVEKVITI